MFGSTSRAGAYQSIGIGYTSDGVYVPGGPIELTTAYGVRGAFNHSWIRTGRPACSEATRPSLYGTAKANYCAAFAAPEAAVVSALTSPATRTSTSRSSV